MSQEVKCIIIEDEPEAQFFLANCIKRKSSWQILATCNNGIEAVRQINLLQPDVIFLDIEMPGMNGFELLEKLSDHWPAIIFVTAHNEYAVDAFEVNALDYILKPFDEDRIAIALRRFKLNPDEHMRADLIKEVIKFYGKKRTSYQTKIPVKSNGKTHLIKCENIQVIEAYDNYLKLHDSNNFHLIKETMSNMEEKLDPKDFVRIHRSFMINLNEVVSLEPISHGEYLVEMKNTMLLKLTRNYQHALDRILNQ